MRPGLHQRNLVRQPSWWAPFREERQTGSAVAVSPPAAQLVQAAWTLLLHDSTGDRDVLFGNVCQPEGRTRCPAPTGSWATATSTCRPGCRWIHGATAALAAVAQLDDRATQWSPLGRITEVSQVPAGTDLYESCLFFMDGPLRAAPKSGVWRRIIAAANTEHPLRFVVSQGRHRRRRPMSQRTERTPRPADYPATSTKLAGTLSASQTSSLPS